MCDNMVRVFHYGKQVVMHAFAVREGARFSGKTIAVHARTEWGMLYISTVIRAGS